MGKHNAIAFTLNLNPDTESRARSAPDWFRRRLVRHVGSEVPLVLAFGAADGRVHVHGAFAAKDADDVDRISAGLVVSAGQWAASRGDAYQLHVQPLGGHRSPDGWASYLLRNVEEAARVTVAGPLWSLTNPARRAAKALLDDIRRAIAQVRATA